MSLTLTGDDVRVVAVDHIDNGLDFKPIGLVLVVSGYGVSESRLHFFISFREYRP